MSEDLNEVIVVAYFSDAEAADRAAHALMNWDDADDDVKLGAMGRLTVKEGGKLDAKRYGAGRTGRGALVGGAVGLLAAGLTGGLSLLAGVVGGGAIGGVTGKLTAGSFGLSDASLDKIKAHLVQGGAAVIVMCDDEELEATMRQLDALGGKAQSMGVSTKVLEAIHQEQLDQWKDDQFLQNWDVAPLY